MFGGGDMMQRMQMMTALQAIQNSKVDRKLYIGNIPQNITPQSLTDLLNGALRKMSVNIDPPGDSISSCWISTDGTYAFAEFRTAEEANNGFALNNIAIHG
jgi:splicing factor U2AF subunit